MSVQPTQKTKSLTTRNLRGFKLREQGRALQMLTCYDFQTAQMLSETSIDMLLVGDSLGNVVLGLDHTVGVSLEHMKIFGAAVKRGAKNKFVVVDMPFGTYATLETGVKNAIELFQSTGAEALKLEGASEVVLKVIKRLVDAGIPVMGHIGLTPQSVHEMGGYFTHGKDSDSAERLIKEAKKLQKAGAFSIVLECVTKELATHITEELNIPTIGIGSGSETDGQVLVINDLLKMGPATPPKFCTPIADFYKLKMELITTYLNSKSSDQKEAPLS